MSAPSLEQDDKGFITPTFAGLGLAVALVGVAFLLAARQDVASARQTFERQARTLRLEGVAESAVLRILDTPKQDWLAWHDGGEVVAEPEGRKINPLFAERSENQAVVARLVGPARAPAVAEALAISIAGLPRLARRQDIAAVSDDPRWRDCAASAFSPYSQQTALTLRPDPGSGSVAHRGEIWRIVASDPQGAWLERTIRLTGAAGAPADILEQSAGFSGAASRVACLHLIDITERRHDEG